MASIAMGATDVASYNHTLVADTVDTVTIARDAEKVRVYNDTGSAVIWFTVDSSAPAANGGNCYRVPATAGAYTTVTVTGAGNTVVKLVSSGTPTYAVEASL